MGHECDKKKHASRILVGKPEVKRVFGRPRHRWKNIKIDHTKLGVGYGLDSSGSRGRL
jgi:hypothetical protein